MPDGTPDPAAQAAVANSHYDLAIIGAGICGLNALFVASEYLPSSSRVLLVDRRGSVGGMWTDTYPFVRLHQPHPSFTVGDLPWNWSQRPGYLARRDEVADHLTRCYDTTRARLSVTEAFGTECTDIAEVQGPQGAHVSITLKDADGAITTATAAQAINAIGLDIPKLAPLVLSSDAVGSVAPGDLDPTDLAPAYIVGGGKTAMDTALRLIAGNPDRPVTMLNGRGTIFGNRDLTLPEGLPRHWRGHSILGTFRDLSNRFDGTNAGDVFRFFRETFSISLDGTGEQFLFGLLGEGEAETISAGLTELIGDYLEDVVDGANGPEMVLRSGTRRSIPAGSQVVNCTGHVLRKPRDYRPYMSPGGRIVTITSRSATHFLSSVAGYFLPHMFFSGKLRDAPLYELDLDALRPIDRQLLHITGVTHTFHNTMVFMDTLPFKVLDRCHLDLDRWFPLHRRLVTFLDVKMNKTRYMDHARKALNRVHGETGVRCGPLSSD